MLCPQILHESRVYQTRKEDPETTQWLEGLRHDNLLYVTPRNMNDDMFWMYAPIRGRAASRLVSGTLAALVSTAQSDFTDRTALLVGIGLQIGPSCCVTSRSCCVSCVTSILHNDHGLTGELALPQHAHLANMPTHHVLPATAATGEPRPDA